MVDRRPNIWKLQANRDTKGLIAALAYSDPDIRKRAAAALRVLGAVEAVEPLREVLKNERQPDVREHLTAALEHLDESFAAIAEKEKNRDELIQVLLSTPDEQILIDTAGKLGEMGDQLATESLVVVFRDTRRSDSVRLAAARALLQLKSAPSVVTLLAGLEKENWRIRHNAAAVLGQLRATWATQALANALNDEHPNVRLAAAAALQRFQTRESTQALIAYQKRRSGKTKPLPRRPESELKKKAAERPKVVEPPIKPPTATPTSRTTTASANNSGTAENASQEQAKPPPPAREHRFDKRETQQIKPRLPITPTQSGDSDQDDKKDETNQAPDAKS